MLFYIHNVECRQGYRRDADSGNCVICPKGTYSDTPDAASCTSCPEGQTTPGEGADVANRCYGKKQAQLLVLFTLEEVKFVKM